MNHHAANDKTRETAASYALGALGLEEAREFEDHLTGGCSVCRSELDAFAATVSALAFSTAEQQPPRETRSKLLSSLDNDRNRKQVDSYKQVDSMGSSAAQFVSIRGAQGEWRELQEGVLMKQLYVDHSIGLATSLVKMLPGTSLPRHRHNGVEQFYVIEGDCHVHGETLGAGDYHRAEAGSIHNTTYTLQGTMFLLVAPVSYEILEAR
jgi:anti-sigma factor ChrR (cupin superfamily)